MRGKFQHEWGANVTSAALAIHVGAGLIGLASGAAALVFAKGGGRHRAAGKLFVLSMLCMCGAAIYLAVIKSETPNIFAAIVTAYMVVTAWLAASRRTGKRGAAQIGTCLVAVAGGISAFVIGWKAVGDYATTTPLAPVAFSFCGLMVIAAVGDLRIILASDLSGAQRLTRHLWRMCAAMFIASASFFIGQGANVFPQTVRDTKILFAPVVAVVVVMIYWLVRVSLKSDKRDPASSDKILPWDFDRQIHSFGRATEFGIASTISLALRSVSAAVRSLLR